MGKFLSLAALLLALAACGPDEAALTGGDPAESPGRAAAETGQAHVYPEAALEEPDWSEVVARVNGEPITRRLLASQVDLAAADRPLAEGNLEKGEVGTPEETAAALETEQLRNLIVLELACQEALRLGYAPGEEELDRALDVYKKDFNEPGFIYQVLDHYGSTEEDLKKQLQKNMALKKWQATEFLPEISVGEEEARAFYQANLDLLRHDEMLRLSQILVGVSLLASPAVKDQARSRAEAALGRLAAGEDFGTLAAEMNADPEAAENLGDLGWSVQGQSLPAIEAEAWKLPVGAHSGLLETILGFHIVKVTGRRPPGVESFDSLRPELVEFIAARKLEEVLDRKIQDLVRSADIEIFDAALLGARPSAGP